MEFMEFEENGRTFIGRRASSPATPDTMWWWLEISGESQRYAAFRAEPDDTEKNLRPRFVAYYEKLLADRERPREIPKRWSRPAPAAPGGQEQP